MLSTVSTKYYRQDFEFVPSTLDRLPRLEDTEKGTATPEALPMTRAVLRAMFLTPSEAIEYLLVEKALKVLTLAKYPKHMLIQSLTA